MKPALAGEPQMEALTKLETTPQELPETFSIVNEATHNPRDPRALRILAKSIYRELRRGGLVEEDVLTVAGELLGLVTSEVKDRQHKDAGTK